MRTRLLNGLYVVLGVIGASVGIAHADFTIMADSATSSVQSAITSVGPAVIGVAGFCAAIAVIIVLLRKAAK